MYDTIATYYGTTLERKGRLRKNDQQAFSDAPLGTSAVNVEVFGVLFQRESLERVHGCCSRLCRCLNGGIGE